MIEELAHRREAICQQAIDDEDEFDREAIKAIEEVAAETPEQALAAVALFRVKYRRLPAATTLEAARRPKAA